MTEKERRSIELARRFWDINDGVPEQRWRERISGRSELLTPNQFAIVRRYADGKSISGENMFLLFHGHGIKLLQIEAAGFVCIGISECGRLARGYSIMTYTVETWKEDLCLKIFGEWRPTLTLRELCDDGYPDLALSVRKAIISEWRAGKRDLPPGMCVSMTDKEFLEFMQSPNTSRVS